MQPVSQFGEQVLQTGLFGFRETAHPGAGETGMLTTGRAAHCLSGGREGGPCYAPVILVTLAGDQAFSLQGVSQSGHIAGVTQQITAELA